MNELSKWISGRGILFIALFSFAVLLSDQVKVAAIWGATNQYFTLFQFIGPIAGGFLGIVAGTFSVLFAEILSFIYLGKEANLINILRLVPMLFAAYYFATFGQKKVNSRNFAILMPLAAMFLFITNPIGGQAWYYSLYWTIPVIAILFFKDNLFARSLGASFTAHSIGGIIWLYTVPTTPAFWSALIPVVMMERFAFAIGISVSYVAFNTLLNRLGNYLPSKFIEVDRRYALFSKPEPVRLKMRK